MPITVSKNRGMVIILFFDEKTASMKSICEYRW